jgi:hypothetical protein
MSPKSTEAALELDTDAAGYTRGAGVHFAGFPGVWEPGRPVAISELGFASADEALDLVDELGLPLRKVRVPAGSAPMPERPNHVASQLDTGGGDDEGDVTVEAAAGGDGDAVEESA